ncbi:MAG TPA: hypothetical protein VIO94_04830 [Phenylobacterium sp.]
MANPRDTRTNAADTAPGVGDGPIRGRGPNANSKPGGRGLVGIIVGVSLVILAIVFMTRQGGGDADQGQASVGASTSEIERSTVPGTQNENLPVTSTAPTTPR